MSTRGHRPVKPVRLRRFTWMYCIRCGLIYLRNAATEAAIRRACPADE